MLSDNKIDNLGPSDFQNLHLVILIRFSASIDKSRLIVNKKLVTVRSNDIQHLKARDRLVSDIQQGIPQCYSH